MLSCENVFEHLKGSTLVLACDLTPGDVKMVRLMTPFRYPDGSNIDVFVADSLPMFGKVEVTDFGQTLDWLSDLGIDPSATKRRKLIVDDICRHLGLDFDGWQIKSEPLGFEDVSSALIRVAQACIRVADLIFTQRMLSVSVLKDEVEEFIAGMGLDYEEDAEIPTKNGDRLLRVDFRIMGPRRSSLLQLLPGGSQVTANAIFRRWYELNRIDNPYQFLTVYDTKGKAEANPHDLRVLEDLSVVLPWDDRDGIRDVLVA